MKVIVSRHAAAIEFIRASDPTFVDAPVVAQATEDDVRGRVVAGNLPLHLAALAAEVVAVEFVGNPPRGIEYTLADMIAAGARLARYRVTALSSNADPYRSAIVSLTAGKPLAPLEEVVAEAGYTTPTEMIGVLVAHVGNGYNSKRRYYAAPTTGRVYFLGCFGREGGISEVVGNLTNAAECLLPPLAFSRLRAGVGQ